jgi:hypothetical protein
VLLSFAGLAQHKGGNKKPKAYNSSDYPSDQYNTKIDTASLGVVKIRLIHVMSTGLTEDAGCKAWLEVKKGNKSTGMLFYDDIQFDNAAGLFFPKKQPREDLFMVCKFGDFDGRIIVIDRDGKINDSPGGDFYVSEDNNYLFSNYSSDQNGVTILDLGKNNALYVDSATMAHKLGAWYYQDNKYFAVTADSSESDDQITIGTYDIHKKKVIFSQVDKTYPEKDAKLEFYSFYTDPKNKGNCNCGKR